MTRLATILGVGALLLGAAWSLEFAAFDRQARYEADMPADVDGSGADGPDAGGPYADGIVALTGGADRVDKALELLARGRAPLLLISGVGHGAELAALEQRVRLSPDQSARVTLGREATSTVGNAEETAAWARAHNVRSLIVVTAGYHMPRALVELGRALPATALYPVPVKPPALRGPAEISTLRVLAIEYDKFLAVALGLTRRTDKIPGSGPVGATVLRPEGERS